MILLIVREDPMAISNVICCVETLLALTLSLVVVPVESISIAPIPAVKLLANKLLTDSVSTVKEDTSAVLKVP